MINESRDRKQGIRSRLIPVGIMPALYISFKKSRLFWFTLFLTVLMLCETLLISVFTGHLPTNISFLLLDKFDFFIEFLRDVPVDALTLIFVDKPLFVIASMQKDPVTAIWGLHYYGYTLIIHLLVAFIFSHVMTSSKSVELNWRAFPVLGSVLLIFSSLFLYLSSCCSVGGNWILETMLLAIIFDPVTASDAILDLYTVIEGGFIWLQTVMSLLGIFLVVSKLGNKS